MTTDLTLTSARADRDQLATRVDVLNKVGVLATLPDDMHVMTESVAAFYDVPRDTISALVSRNRDELEADGYRVVTRSAFEGTYNMQVPSSASKIALFPRRAVLRVGMLLRDSGVARQVRDYLLAVEEAARESDDQILEKAFGILRERNAALTAENTQLRAANEQLGEKAEIADRILDAEGDLDFRDAAQSLTRAGIKLGRQRLFKLADEHYDWIFRSNTDGRWRVRQSAIESGFMSVIPQSHYHPKTGVLVLDPPQPRITPKGLQRILVDHGGVAA